MLKRRSSKKSPPEGAAVLPALEDIPPAFAEICKRWALRALIDFGGYDSIVQGTCCTEPDLMRALGMQSDVIEDYEQDRMIKALKELHRYIVKSHTSSHDDNTHTLGSGCVLSRNIEWLSSQVSLANDEKQILLFSVLVRQNLFLGQAIEALLPWNVKAALSTKPMTETIVELESQV